MKEYIPKLKEAIIPIFGDFIYRNRTLDNPRFMNSVGEDSIKNSKTIDKILKYYAWSSSSLLGFVIAKYIM